MSWEQSFQEIIAEADASGLACSPAAAGIACAGLGAIDEKYGPESAKPLAHHNVPHALDVMRRGIRLANILQPYIDEKYREDLSDLIIVGGAYHDYEQSEGFGVNEKESADASLRAIDESPEKPWRDIERFKARAHLGIMATEIAIKPNGEIVQVNLCNGGSDPLKYIMAFADINGIAMEGAERMLEDCANLCKERYGDVFNEQVLSEFLETQPFFLRTRLHERRIKADLAYYFLDDMPVIYDELTKAFGGNAAEASIYAKLLKSDPLALLAVASRIMKVKSILPLNKK